jgi:hypothetical protein
MKKHISVQDPEGDITGVSRRRFVKMAGITALGVSSLGLSDFYAKGVSIASDPADLIAGSLPALWAVKELEQSLTSQGINVFRCDQPAQARPGDLCIVVAGSGSSLAQKLLKAGRIVIPDVPEALGLVPGKLAGKQVLMACGNDQRGLIYALLELADRVNNSTRPFESLSIQKPVIERPANVIRSINRLFVSDIEDKPWFNDREMWPQYLTVLILV